MNMRSLVITGCLIWLAVAAKAQPDTRVVNIHPLRDGNGNIISTSIPGTNPIQANISADTVQFKKQTQAISLVSRNPYAITINSLHAQCDPNSILLSWTAVQPGQNADRFDIEQSNNGGINWFVIGTVPASRFETGEISYTFKYNETISDARIRVVAMNTGGERTYSSIIQSPCRGGSSIMVTPNPVYSMAIIRINSTAASQVKLVLVNNSGVVVQTKETGVLAGENPLSFDMSNFPKGYYTLSVQWPSGKQDALKIVKE